MAQRPPFFAIWLAIRCSARGRPSGDRCALPGRGLSAGCASPPPCRAVEEAVALAGNHGLSRANPLDRQRLAVAQPKVTILWQARAANLSPGAAAARGPRRVGSDR